MLLEERGRKEVAARTLWKRSLICGTALLGAGLVVGCASPGAPKPPSLGFPAVVQDLTAERSGNAVELQFSVPSRTSDGLPLRSTSLTGVLCRQPAPGAACKAVTPQPAGTSMHVPRSGAGEQVHWTDTLPPNLASGPVRPIAYRVEILNSAGRGAGYSEPHFVAAGAAPPSVEGLTAQGMRTGVLLRWQPITSAVGEVLLRRTDTHAAPAKGSAEKRTSALSKASAHANLPRNSKREENGVTWLQAQPGHPEATQTIDGTVAEGVPYSYVAVRRVRVKVGGRALELRSAPSTSAPIVWRDVFPPVAPGELTAVGFTAPGKTAQDPETYAVDLIWQPVSDPRVTGYLVTRTALGADGTAEGSPERLNAAPVAAPAFHDTTALPGRSYRYQVVATDAKGNVSAPAVATVTAHTR